MVLWWQVDCLVTAITWTVMQMPNGGSHMWLIY